MTNANNLVVVLLIFVAGCAYGEVLCANEASSLVAPVFITNRAALSARVGGSGSATFEFQTTSGSLWALTRCPDGNSDSWIVNGQVWHIPQSNTFQWHMFGTPAAIPGSPGTINLIPRESNCEIQSLYFGNSGQLLLNGQLSKTCETAFNRGYLCTSQASLHLPVTFDSSTNSFFSPIGFPQNSQGRAILDFAWKSSFGTANLWVFSQCPNGNSDSWFVDGNMTPIPHSSTFTWNKIATADSGNVVLAPREPNCRIKFAYLGKDIPNESFADSCPPEDAKCVGEAAITGNIIGVEEGKLVGSCTPNQNNPSDPCIGSASFDFGLNRGAFWAYTKCPNGNSDSWIVNGQVWHIPQSSSFTWNRFGPVDGDGVIELRVREANCEIGGVFRGQGEPTLKTCVGTSERLTDRCSQNINCFHGVCSADRTYCQCHFYAFGCQCDYLWSGPPSSQALCAFDFSIEEPPAFSVAKPEDEIYTDRAVVLYYTHPRSLFRVVVDTKEREIVSHEVCRDGFVNANGIAVDSEEGVFVADSQASRLLYVPPGCGTYTVVIPQNHFIASPADVEILHSHGLLVVASWSRPGIYFVEVNSDRELVRYSNTGATNQFALGLTECKDKFGNDGFLFVEQGNTLVFYDVIKEEKTVILTQPSGVVDIIDVQFRPGCGIVFSAGDNSQVWMCSEKTDPSLPYSAQCKMPSTSCRKLCDTQIDSSACLFLHDPAGLALDCQCNVYQGNKANGNLVLYPNANGTLIDGELIEDNVFANDFEIFGPSECGADLTGPIVTLCGSPSTVGQGQQITVTVTADEPIFKPVVRCFADVTPLGEFTVSGVDFQRTYTATYTVQVTDPTGVFVTCEMDEPIDASGNNGTFTFSAESSCQVFIGVSPTPSPTRTPSPSTSPTRSPSPSTSVTPTVTPSPSVSPSPSTSVTPTVTRTPSVSPSPSRIPISMQVDLFGESGECSTDGCVNTDPRNNISVRVSAKVSRVQTFGSTFVLNEAAACAGIGGSYQSNGLGQFVCISTIEFADLFRWAVVDFDVYRRLIDGAAPPFFDAPQLAAGGTHPNTVPGTNNMVAVAAAVDCTNLPSSASIRWSWLRTQLGPCYNDPTFGVTICSPAGKGTLNNEFRNQTGAVLPDDAIVKDFSCPLK